MILEGQKAIEYIDKFGIHFKPKEFICKCGCGQIKFDTDNLQRLESIRSRLGFPVIINSGYRCPEHNKNVGGEKDSYHTKGMAYDITVSNNNIIPFSELKKMIIDYAIFAGFTGIGMNYDTFVHVDNGKQRRW